MSNRLIKVQGLRVKSSFLSDEIEPPQFGKRRELQNKIAKWEDRVNKF
jgi:hypothetical protein